VQRRSIEGGEVMAAVDGETEEGTTAVAFIGRGQLGFV
jgi:hypothetical protein